MVYNPINALDKVVLTQYAKVRKVWDPKSNKSIYKLTMPLGLLGLYTYLPGMALSNSSPLDFLAAFIVADDIAVNRLGLQGYWDRFDYISSERVKEPFICRPLNRLLRLPTFLGGAGLSSFGIYGLVNGFLNMHMNYNEFGYLLEGLGALAVASSMYLKDADPKLLQRQPSKLKAKLIELPNKIKGFIPRRPPVLKPVFNSLLKGLETELYPF